MQRTSPTMSVILREVERLVSDLIELSMRHNLAYWGTMGAVPRGWARSASGDTAQGIAWIEEGIAYYRATGSVLVMSYFLGLKAEALHLAARTAEALETIREAEVMAEKSEAALLACRTAPAARDVSGGSECGRGPN